MAAKYSKLQQDQAAWSLARFGEVPADLQALKVIEEIGELAKAHLAGIYGKDSGGDRMRHVLTEAAKQVAALVLLALVLTLALALVTAWLESRP